MSESPNPGVGGSYRYNPTTDKTELVDFTFDPYSPPHPGAEDLAPAPDAPTPEPPPAEPGPVDPFEPLA